MRRFKEGDKVAAYPVFETSEGKVLSHSRFVGVIETVFPEEVDLKYPYIVVGDGFRLPCKETELYSVV